MPKEKENKKVSNCHENVITWISKSIVADSVKFQSFIKCKYLN